MKVKISASLLSANLSRLEQEVQAVQEAGCDFIHIDVMDGVYVPNITFGTPLMEAVKAITTLPLDVHLMIVKPEHHSETFAKLGAHCISFHPETTYHPHRLIQRLQALGVLAGIVLNPGFSCETIKPLLQSVQRVTVMTVNPGFGGQSFITHQLNVIQELSHYIQTHHLAVEIAVDGGMNLETAPLCLQAGADILITGNALFKADSYKEFVGKLSTPP